MSDNGAKTALLVLCSHYQRTGIMRPRDSSADLLTLSEIYQTAAAPFRRRALRVRSDFRSAPLYKLSFLLTACSAVVLTCLNKLKASA